MRIAALLVVLVVPAGCSEDPERAVRKVTRVAGSPSPATEAAVTATPPPPSRVRGIPAFTGPLSIALVDPRTLKPLGPEVDVTEPGGGTVASPSARYVAAGIGDFPDIEIIDLVTGRRRQLEFGHNGPVDHIGWLSEDQLVVITGKQGVMHVVDARSGRRMERRPLRGYAQALDRGVVLLAPDQGIGPARLALPGGRQVILPAIRAGSKDLPPGEDEIPRSRGLMPALVVDERMTAAYVAAADSDMMARVDLRTGELTMHDAGIRGASVSKAMNYRSATAYWTGQGWLAVTREHGTETGGIVQYPLRVVDTNLWRVKRIFRRGGYMQPAPGGVVVARPDGKVVRLARTGNRIWTVDVGGTTPGVQVAGGRVYAQSWSDRDSAGDTRVISLRSGRVLRRIEGEPPGFVVSS